MESLSTEIPKSQWDQGAPMVEEREGPYFAPFTPRHLNIVVNKQTKPKTKHPSWAAHPLALAPIPIPFRTNNPQKNTLKQTELFGLLNFLLLLLRDREVLISSSPLTHTLSHPSHTRHCPLSPPRWGVGFPHSGESAQACLWFQFVVFRLPAQFW